jgi:hypothetical protein
MCLQDSTPLGVYGDRSKESIKAIYCVFIPGDGRVFAPVLIKV